MAASSHNRAFQAYNNQNFPNKIEFQPSSATCSSAKEPLVFGRIPYSAIKTTIESTSSPPPSPNPKSILKPTPIQPKRCSSVTSVHQMLPRRKSLQMTALASQRQSLWMNIAKNAQANDSQTSSSFPLRHPQTNLLRKKFLRLLLVFSYLLSISLFGIALVTFYGFFWTGYGTTSPSTDRPTIITLKSNTSIIDIDFSLEDVS